MTIRPLLLATLLVSVSAGQTAAPSAETFLGRVAVEPLARLGVLSGGRVMPLETYARQQMRLVSGRESFAGASPVASYLEIYFAPGEYADRPMVRIRNGRLQGALAEYLAGMGRPVPGPGSDWRFSIEQLVNEPPDASWQNRYRGPLGLDQPGLLLTGIQNAALDPASLRRDANRVALAVKAFVDPAVPIIPPGDDDGPFNTLDELAHAIESGERLGHFVDPRLIHIDAAVMDLARSWRARDVAATNQAAAELAEAIRQANPAAQPSEARVSAEIVYNRMKRFTWAWAVYLPAFVLLAAGVATRRRALTGVGMGVFVLATLMLAAGFAIRWWISGRPWYLPPWMNQFESVTGAALLGAVAALVIEAITRKGLFAMGASFVATVALLCGYALPQRMGADIRPPQGILNNWILPLHVGTIILGYAMIGIGLVISVAYLLTLVRHRDARRASAPVDLTGSLGDGPDRLAELDRCNLIVAQLACWMVTLGTILGAVWADYSWGRWWGFDAKETWALITMLIYLAIIHARPMVTARRRGLWTAGLTVAGAAVMLFNWVVVKYLLPSLHGYA